MSDWFFHPVGGEGEEAGGAPAGATPKAPGGDQAPPLHPLTGMPSSMPQVGATSRVNDPSRNVYRGTQFAQTGLGRYMNRNNNGMQFNKPAIMGAVRNGIQMYDDAKYYRTHGMGAALRTVTGLPQLPSHRNDDINSRYRANTASTHGSYPGHMEADVATQAAHPSADPNDLVF